MKEPKPRPDLGQWVTIVARIEKKHERPERTVWERTELPLGLRVLFIGYRRLSEGHMDEHQGWNDPNDYERYFDHERQFEGWLVVANPRRRPFFVLPEDCDWVDLDGKFYVGSDIAFPLEVPRVSETTA